MSISVAAAMVACMWVCLCGAGASSHPLTSRSDTCHPKQCCFTRQPIRKNLDGGFIAWKYTEPWRAEYFQDDLIVSDEAYKKYTTWLNETIPRDFGDLNPFDQRACLIHQRKIFAGAGYPTYNWDIILNGTVGGLYKMNCIESLMWTEQNKYNPQTESATEFGAYILKSSKRANHSLMKVYLQTGPTLSVPGMSWVDPDIQSDIENGEFEVVTFLHLHPFVASNIKYQDCAGTCIPSGPDLQAFASDLSMFKAESAWITNGADSFRFPLTQLDKFHKDESFVTPEIFKGEEPQIQPHFVRSD